LVVNYEDDNLLLYNDNLFSCKDDYKGFQSWAQPALPGTMLVSALAALPSTLVIYS
jgi:hypothetical protein